MNIHICRHVYHLKSIDKFFLHSNNVISIVKDSAPNYIGSVDRRN